MDEAVGRTVHTIAAACRSGDVPLFRVALAEFKALVVHGQAGQAIGPKLAFGTLAPAGDEIGEALAEIKLEQGLPLLEELAADASGEIRSMACRCLLQLGRRYPQAIVPVARRLAADERWEVREFIANALDEMADEQGEFVHTLMTQWVHDPDPRVRRVPTNALMRYGRRNAEPVVALMKQLLHDESMYVRQNVVFCLAVMGAARVPALGGKVQPDRPRWLMGVLREWSQDDDERARWIIAKALGRSWVKACPAEALALLDFLGSDSRRRVRAAVLSSAKAVRKLLADEAMTRP